MKKLLFFIIPLALISCGNPVKTIDQNFKAYVQENEGDPSSYEPIETIIIDTLHTSELIDKGIKSFEPFHLQYKEHTANVTAKMNAESDPREKQHYNEILADYDARYARDSYIKSYNQYTDFKKTLKDDVVEFILATHKCRIKNRFGILDLTTFYVLTDKDLNILSVKKYDYEIHGSIKSIFKERYNLEKF